MDLSNYGEKKKADLKGATGVDTLNLATKLDLACFNTEVEQKNWGKLKTVSSDLSKLSNVVDDDVDHKTIVYNKLVAKVNLIDASRFILKTQCYTVKSNTEKNMYQAY